MLRSRGLDKKTEAAILFKVHGFGWKLKSKLGLHGGDVGRVLVVKCLAAGSLGCTQIRP